jgi:predicted nucleotidyltransferase
MLVTRMADLRLLAEELAVSDRTLRRAAARGTIHGWRRGRQARVELPIQEVLYLERAWPLLNTLVGELRTLPNVRLAVLFGSRARGDPHPRSDLDLLVRFAESGLRARGRLLARLEEALPGEQIQVVELENANPLLLVDVIRDGRVLVDRDGDWSTLRGRAPALGKQAATTRRELEERLAGDLEELFAEASL